MKTKMKAAIVILALTTGFVTHAQEKAITVSELPTNAQTFLRNYFEKETVAGVWKDTDMFDTDYKLRLTSGVEVEFDNKGNWEEVQGEHNAIPVSVLPVAIRDYLSQNYKGQNANGIDRERWGYKVELANDIELEFDNSGKFLRIDD